MEIFWNIYSLASILILSDILAVLNYFAGGFVYHSILILHTCPRAFRVSRNNNTTFFICTDSYKIFIDLWMELHILSWRISRQDFQVRRLFLRAWTGDIFFCNLLFQFLFQILRTERYNFNLFIGDLLVGFIVLYKPYIASDWKFRCFLPIQKLCLRY